MESLHKRALDKFLYEVPENFTVFEADTDNVGLDGSDKEVKLKWLRKVVIPEAEIHGCFISAEDLMNVL